MYRSLRRSALALALLTLAGTASHAQSAHPSFAGNWVLDVEKSTKGPIVPPGLTMEVAMEGTTLKIHRVVNTPAGDSEASFTYATDGSTSTNQVRQGPMQFDAKSVVTWAGPVLNFDTHIQAGEQEVAQKESWSLSPDGKALSITRNISANGQEMSATMVLNRKG